MPAERGGPGQPKAGGKLVLLPPLPADLIQHNRNCVSQVERAGGAEDRNGYQRVAEFWLAVKFMRISTLYYSIIQQYLGFYKEKKCALDFVILDISLFF